MPTWGQPPSAVRRSNAPQLRSRKTLASSARLDSRGRLSPRGLRYQAERGSAGQMRTSVPTRLAGCRPRS